MNEGYLVIDINPAKNQVNGGFMFKIRMLDIKTKKVFVTYIDPANRNYTKWDYIVNDFNQGQVLTNLKKIKHKNRELIDADSTPVRVYVGPRSELEQILHEHWNRPATQYEQLFEATV